MRHVPRGTPNDGGKGFLSPAQIRKQDYEGSCFLLLAKIIITRYNVYIMDNLINHWKIFNFALAGVIFFSYFIIDGLYAYYTYSVIKKKPFASANTGFVMHFLLAFGVINYVNNFLYIIPLALGSWCGTYVVVLMEKNNIRIINWLK
ncbi:MAG: hypothetical protein WC682_00105 [Parcubacteria group bacterium]